MPQYSACPCRGTFCLIILPTQPVKIRLVKKAVMIRRTVFPQCCLPKQSSALPNPIQIQPLRCDPPRVVEHMDLRRGKRLGNCRHFSHKSSFCALLLAQTKSAHLKKGERLWRTGWDSNPRRACTLAGFQDRCIQPLCHLSARQKPLGRS